MNVVEAMEVVKNLITTVLTDSGFVSGTGLSEDAIKAETKPIFYMMNVPTATGSSKSRYIVWDYGPIGNIYGDGKAVQFTYRANVTFYSNHPDLFTYLKQLVSGFEDDDHDVTLQRAYFDTTFQMFVFELSVSRLVYVNGEA